MLRVYYLCILTLLLSQFTWAQPSASGKKTWSLYSSAGMVSGMNERTTDFQFGLTKSIKKWDIFGDLHLNSYDEASVFNISASLGRDLLRLDPKKLKRHPYYLFTYGGIGVTHLSDPILFDSFLLRGDDMLHLSLGVQTRMMLTRDFGIMSDIRFNQNLLIDYELKRSFNINFGFLLKLK
jgi:hypothetical protein